LNKLDNILKQQMETFAPDAPNIWSGIEQGVQANAAAQTATVAKTIGSKLVITIAKIVAIVVIPASIIVYMASNEKTNIDANTKVLNNNLSTNKNNEVIKIDDSKEEVSLNIPIKSYKNSATKKVISNNNINSNYLEKSANEIVIINKQSNFEQINNSNKGKNEKVVIVSNELNKDNLNKEVAESREAETIEENEIKGDFSNAGNETGIRIFPNVFTPDNDGIDDRYVIDIDGEKFYNLKIYNYNNELVFESNDKNITWDGINFKTGQVCNIGTYYGIFEFKLSNEEKNSKRMTKIKLIR
jgi:hypothetical protein